MVTRESWCKLSKTLSSKAEFWHSTVCMYVCMERKKIFFFGVILISLSMRGRPEGGEIERQGYVSSGVVVQLVGDPIDRIKAIPMLAHLVLVDGAGVTHPR